MVFNNTKLLLHLFLLYTTVQAGKSGGLRQQNRQSISRELASSCSASNESSWKLALTVDDYPWETRWTIKDSSGNKVAYGPPDDTNYEKGSEYEETGCLPPGEYVFTVKDRGGDGLCCTYGDGKFELTINNDVIVESDTSAFKRLDFPFTAIDMSGSVAAVDGITADSSSSTQTNEPTKDPTESPSNRPTSKLSLYPTTVGVSFLSSHICISLQYSSKSIKLHMFHSKKPVSQSPTESPSFSPTWTPTVTPSLSPVTIPTTNRPTRRPSRRPTVAPSVSPISPTAVSLVG